MQQWFFSLFCWLTFHFCESACWAASHENTTSLASIVCMCTVQKPSGNSKQHNSPDRNIHYRWHRSAWASELARCWWELLMPAARLPAAQFIISCWHLLHFNTESCVHYARNNVRISSECMSVFCPSACTLWRPTFRCCCEKRRH
jgi:hypothetical protein